MSRAHLSRPVQNSSGALVPSATIRLIEPGTDTSITDPIYTNDEGEGTRLNPWSLTTGIVDFYLDEPRRVGIGVTVGEAAEYIIDDVDVVSVGDAGDAAVSGWIESPGSLTAGALSATIEAELATRPETLAYAENRSGLGTLGPPGVAAQILGTTVVVPPSARDVWLEYGAMLGVNAGGQGVINFAVWDITTGVPAAIESLVTRCYSNEVVTVTKATPRGAVRVGPSDVLRRFYLAVATTVEGSGLSGYVRNVAASNGMTFLTAVAR